MITGICSFIFLKYLGAFLWQTIAFTTAALYTSISQFISGFHVFICDFILFLKDLQDGCEHLIMVSTDFTLRCGQSVNDFVSACQQTIGSVYDLFCGGIYCVSYLSSSLLFGLKTLVILTGNGTILLITMIPNCLYYTTCGIVSFARYSSETLVHIVSNVICGVVALLSGVHTELSDIPPSSLFGTLIAFLCAIFLRSYVNNIWRAFWQKGKHIAQRFSNWDIRVYRYNKDETESCSKKSLLQQLEREREDKLCVICLNRNKNIVLQPCLHFCMCEVCMETLSAENYPPICPICRVYVINNLKVYG